MSIKPISVTIIASLVTGTLFLLMNSLVAQSEVIIEDDLRTFHIKVFDEPEEIIVEEIIRDVVKPEEVEIPIVDVDPVEVLIDSPYTNLDFTPPAFTNEVADFVPVTNVDGSAVVLVRVNPRYPQRALSEGVSGWVIVEVSVDASGNVTDSFVVEAMPEGYFERATLKAVERFRFKPAVVEGISQATKGIRYRMSFDIEE